MSHERPDPGDLAPPRPGSISRRLLDWLTPSRPLRALGQLRAVRADARLNIYPIDASSLRLLDPERVHYTFQMLRESGFRQSQLDLTGADLAQLSMQPALLLSALASASWLAVADRALSAATFAFAVSPCGFIVKAADATHEAPVSPCGRRAGKERGGHDFHDLGYMDMP